MTECAKCLNWLCFRVYYKGWSEYSTIGGHSGSSVNIMTGKSSSQAELDACENCSKLSIDGRNDKTTAMVSQAEIWQEDKKFTVHDYLFNNYMTNCQKSFKTSFYLNKIPNAF